VLSFPSFYRLVRRTDAPVADESALTPATTSKSKFGSELERSWTRPVYNLVGKGQPPYSLQIWDSQSGGRSRPHFAIWPLSAQPRRPDASWWRTGVHLKEACGISEITRFAASLGLRLRREERPEPKTMVIVERPTTPKKRTTRHSSSASPAMPPAP
jgi:hypothetical protein